MYGLLCCCNHGYSGLKRSRLRWRHLTSSWESYIPVLRPWWRTGKVSETVSYATAKIMAIQFGFAALYKKGALDLNGTWNILISWWLLWGLLSAFGHAGNELMLVWSLWRHYYIWPIPTYRMPLYKSRQKWHKFTLFRKPGLFAW